MTETYATLKDAIRGIRARLGMTQRAFAEAFGVTAAAVSSWESGTSAPSASSLSILLRAYGAAVEKNESGQVTVSFPKDARKEHRAPNVGSVIESYSEGDVIVPVLLQDAHAGTPHPIVTDESESFNVTRHYRNTIVVKVIGDSMKDAGFEEGDRVVIRRTEQFRDGDICLAQVDGAMFLKGLVREGDLIRFLPANDKYESWTQPASAVHVIGVSIEIIRKTRLLRLQSKPGKK